jgi:hypothetical protein
MPLTMPALTLVLTFMLVPFCYTPRRKAAGRERSKPRRPISPGPIRAAHDVLHPSHMRSGRTVTEMAHLFLSDDQNRPAWLPRTPSLRPLGATFGY